MSRNNRDAYTQPTPEQVEVFRKDPRYVQWNDIAKSAFFFTGKNLSFAEVQAMMKPDLVEKTEFWGWWRMTDSGYRTFYRKENETTA
jgi:hypothetical protein